MLCYELYLTASFIDVWDTKIDVSLFSVALQFKFVVWVVGDKSTDLAKSNCVKVHPFPTY